MDSIAGATTRIVGGIDTHLDLHTDPRNSSAARAKPNSPRPTERASRRGKKHDDTTAVLLTYLDRP